VDPGGGPGPGRLERALTTSRSSCTPPAGSKTPDVTAPGSSHKRRRRCRMTRKC
jgi:hypothetical protein